MQTTPIKVSIVMPSLNVGQYIRQCIESVLNQTLRDIEVICVDAGSTDGTLEILLEYQQKDSRVHIIQSNRKSYGYQVNLGFDAASGEYLGIVETDDYADAKMFETLYDCAKRHDLDAVKSGFYYYYSKGEERDVPNPIASHIMAGRTFCPTTDFRSKMELVEFFNIKPTIWSAIYRKGFIRANGIRLNETPGASFQDTAFNFKVWACSKRVRLLQECFLHYRQDNESSSINSPGKVYCVCDEYDEMERFLNEHNLIRAKLTPVMVRLKFDTYSWNYQRLSNELKEEFIKKWHEDFLRHEQEGSLQKPYFEWYKWSAVWKIIEKPEQYHQEQLLLAENPDAVLPAVSDESLLQKLKRKLIGGYHCLREHGLLYTIDNLLGKIRGRLVK